MASFEFMKPVGEAWDRMVATLFRPFNWKVWAKLGLLAWLGCLFEGSGGISFPHLGGKNDASKLNEALPQWLLHPTPQQLYLIIGAVIALVLLVLVIVVVGCWIKCRGRFLFIDGLVKGLDTPFKERWRKFSEQGNSLFFFMLSWFFATVAALLVPVVALVLIIGKCAASSPQKEELLAFILIVIAISFVIGLMMLASVLLLTLIVDFGTVLMYKHGIGAFEAARRVLNLISSNPWATVKYLFLLLGIGIATMLAVFTFIIVTCCCIGLVILSIPYVWAVVMLPALAFRRLFTIHFIARAGEDFNLLSPETVMAEEVKGI